MGQEGKKSSGFVKKVTNKVRKTSSHSDLTRLPDTMDVSLQRTRNNSLPDLMLEKNCGSKSSKKGGSSSSSSSSRLKKLVQKGKKKEKKEKKRKSDKTKKEVATLYAALDMVTPKYVLQRMDQIRQDESIVLLNVEDLIVNGNEQSEELLVKLSKFFFSGDRAWESINFADNVRPSSFKCWVRSMRETMGFFEDVFREQDGSLGFETLTFQAKMEFEEESRVSVMTAVLRNIKGQRRVAGVKFLIDTVELDEVALAELVGAKDGATCETVMVVVTFGWLPDPDGLSLVESVLRMAREAEMKDGSGLGLRRSGTDPTLLDRQFGDESSDDDGGFFSCSTSQGAKPHLFQRSNTYTGPSRSLVTKNESWLDDDDDQSLSASVASLRMRVRDRRPARVPRNSSRIPNVDTEAGRLRRETLKTPQKKVSKLSEATKQSLRQSLAQASPTAAKVKHVKRLSNPYARDASSDSESESGTSCSSLDSDDLNASSSSFNLADKNALGRNDVDAQQSAKGSGFGQIKISERSQEFRRSISRASSSSSRRERKTVRALSPIDKGSNRMRSSSSAPNFLDSADATKSTVGRQADALKSFQARRRRSSKDSHTALRKSASSGAVPGTGSSKSTHERSLSMKNAEFPATKFAKVGRSKSTIDKSSGTKNAVFPTVSAQAMSTLKVARSSQKPEISLSVQSKLSAHGKVSDENIAAPLLRTRMSSRQSQKLHAAGISAAVPGGSLALVKDSNSSAVVAPKIEMEVIEVRDNAPSNEKDSSPSGYAMPKTDQRPNPDFRNASGEAMISQAVPNEENIPIAMMAISRKHDDVVPGESKITSTAPVTSGDSSVASNDPMGIKRRSSIRVQRILSGSSKKQNMGDLLGKLNAVSLDISNHSQKTSSTVQA